MAGARRGMGSGGGALAAHSPNSWHMNSQELFQAAAHAFGAKDWTQAEALCRQVLAVDPRHANALHMLALVASELGRPDQAIASLRQACAVQPENPVQWTNLGKIYRDAGRPAEAVECHRRAIVLKADLPEPYFNLGLALDDLGRFDEAIAAVRRATELRPDYAAAHYNLGNLFREEGRLQRAVDSYTVALRIRPAWVGPRLNIAAAWLELQEPAKAAEHYREVLRLQPASADAAQSLGHALRAMGQMTEARTAYERAAASPGGESYRDPVSVLARETLAELVAPDQAAIEEHQTRARAAVAEFAAQSPKLNLPELHTSAAVPSMMLAYYGGDVRPLLEQFAQAIGPLIPRCSPSRRHGKPRLGIVVTNGHEGVFAKCWGGIAQRLSRELFDVRIVCSRGGANILQTLLAVSPDEYVRLPTQIDAAARLLEEQQLDWLHYWEIGTDPMNYYLPFFRPALGQSGCWGWPVTSGNPQVSAYLSCRQLEPPEGPAHYSERLVQLERLPTYFVRPAAAEGKDRSHFGLDESAHVYLCTQNVRKYHPDFDPLLADLLRRDPQGLLLVIADAQSSITQLLLERFRRTMPDVVGRVRVMPRMDQQEYLSLIAAADVVLDTLHYGAGANTVYDAVAMGTPLITMPGEFHRTRWAAAVNRRLGLEQLTAATAEEYVATAIEVAASKDLRRELQTQILERGAELFEDMVVVAEHNDYFNEAIAAVRATAAEERNQ
jgi:predicted O-linked N-acetylglucosamine transferase (SPINDLY family)